MEQQEQNMSGDSKESFDLLKDESIVIDGSKDVFQKMDQDFQEIFSDRK